MTRRLLELRRPQEQGLRANGVREDAALAAAAQVALEENGLEGRERSVQTERDRLARTITTCRSHKD
jgi:hypothetical protein